MSRLIQVILQTCLLLLAEQLKTRDPVLQFEKPAKQVYRTTFHLISHIFHGFSADNIFVNCKSQPLYNEFI